MSEKSSGSFAWLPGLVVLLAALYFWRVSMALVAAAALLGLAAWACYRLFSKSGQAHAAMEENDYAAALLLLQQSGDHSQLTGTLRFKVPFPGSAVKESFLEAVRELLTLQEAAADPANPHLPQGLRDDLARRTGESLASLWPLCQKLTLLARSRVQPELLDERISAVAGQLEELAQSARATRHQLAHITLGASELEIHEATEQVGAMKWQVGEMRKLDGMIDG